MTNARILAGRLADLLRVEHGAMVTAVRPTSAPYAVFALPLTEPAGLRPLAPPVTDPAAPVSPVTVPAASVSSVPPPVQPVELDAPPPSLHPRPARRDAAEPLTADLSRLHITVSRRFLEKLEAARAALSHAHPLATAEEILEAGLDLVLERHLRRKGVVRKPRQTAPRQMPRQLEAQPEPPQQEAPQQEPPQEPQNEAPQREPSQEEPSSPVTSYIPA